MTAPWLEGLNDAQRQAVTFGEGPLLVVAGAGTGKTKTLACRVAHLIHTGVAPQRILLLTFTRRAASEMIQRVRRLTDAAEVGRLWGGTFHAIAHRLLRILGEAIRLPREFTVMDEGDAADLMNLIRNETGAVSSQRRFPKKSTLVNIYSHTVNAQAPLREVLDRHFPWCTAEQEALAEIFTGYTQRKRESGLLDYDDLLLFWRELTRNAEVGPRLADRFDHVLVDEYQDTNAIQAAILRGMRHQHKNIMVVGDDAQSIYSFRAATVRNILDFADQFPGAEQITLEENYRSTQPILAASNAVMVQARERFTKDLWSRRESAERPRLVSCADETHQCNEVCQQILAHYEEGVPLHQQGVLFRTAHHSAMLEVELTRRNIPFHKFGGLKFVETAHIKDLLAFLRILENPHDQLSWFRVLQMIPSVGPRTARRIMTAVGVGREAVADNESGRAAVAADGGGRTAASRNGAGLGGPMGSEGDPRSPLWRFLTSPPSVPAPAREEFDGLRAALADCVGLAIPAKSRSAKGGRKGSRKESSKASDKKSHDQDGTPDPGSSRTSPPLAEQLERVRAYYEPIFERQYDNTRVRLADLEQLGNIAARYRSRKRFIADLTLDPPRATSDLAQAPHLDDDYLVLSTIHSAKGCEWKVVHIIHAADGMIPSDMALSDDDGLEEERRLFYVAMTRAAEHLYVYFPLRYYHSRFGQGDAHNYAQLTRFVTRDVRALFEERSADALTGETAPDRSETGADAVDQWLRGLWDG
jgi:DNA helicase-2/ATP-dependent DNA helicase PcrA